MTQLFEIDQNAGTATYSIDTSNSTGAGTLEGTTLTITKAGTITIKVETAANGVYAAGSATAVLTVNKGTPAFPSGTTYSAVYGQTVSQITPALPTGWSWAKPNDPVGDYGERTHQAVFAETDVWSANTADVSVTVSQSGSTMTASLENLPQAGSYTYGDTVKVLVSGVTPTKEAPALLMMLTGTPETDNKIAIFNGEQQLTEYKAPAEAGVSFELVGLNAGTYNLTAKFTGNDNMAATSAPVPQFVINKATPTVNAPTGVTAIYGQTLSQITLTNPEGNTPGVWTWKDGTASVGNAGAQTHYATFTPSDTTNYQTLTNIAVDVSVSKADLTVTPPAALNPTYTGEALALISAGSTNAGTMEYSLDGTNYSTDLPTATNATTYTVYYRVNGTDNYNGAAAASIPASIAKATPVVTAPVPLNPAYTGSAQPLISAGSTTFGTLEYSLDGQNYSTELPTGTDAKAYTVYYRVPGSDNWNEAAAQSITATIGQIETAMTMTPATQTVTYGMDATFTVTAQPATQQGFSLRSLIAPAKNQVAIFYGNTQLTEAQTVTGEELTFTVNTKTAGLNANVNAYTLTAKYVGNDNMKDQTATAAVTVTKANGSGSVSITGWTYGTTANAPVPATTTNDVNAVTYLYTGTTNAGVPYSDASAPTEAGEYSVTATFAETTNYTAYTTAPVTFTIAKTDDLTDVMPSNLTAIYGHTLSTVTLPQNWSWADSTDEVGGKGENKHKANYAGDANYNAKSNVELIVTVGQSESTLTADSDKDAYTYGETVTIEAVLAQPQQTFNLLRAFTPAASGQMAVYNGSTQLTAAQNAKYGETLTFTLDTEADGLTPGSYTLTVKFIESDNMAEASADVSFTVSWLDLTNIPDPTLPDGSTGSGEGQDGDGWFSGDVTVTAPDGYEISTDGGETWGPTGTIDTSGSPDGENTYDYLLQDTQTGEIGTGSITIQTDNTDPVVSTPTVNSTDTTATISAPATDVSSGIAGSTLTQTGGEPAVTITNNGNGTFSITGMTPGETYTFDLTVTDNAGNTTTITGIIVTASAAVAIVWPTEDQIVTVYEGEQAEMSVIANNAFRYQWYINYNDGTGWRKKEGATSATYISSPTELDNSGFQYGCIAFGESGEVYAKSPIFTLEVLKVPVLPETGDDRPIGLWISLLTLSLTGMLLILRGGKRRYNH